MIFWQPWGCRDCPHQKNCTCLLLFYRKRPKAVVRPWVMLQFFFGGIWKVYTWVKKYDSIPFLHQPMTSGQPLKIVQTYGTLYKTVASDILIRTLFESKLLSWGKPSVLKTEGFLSQYFFFEKPSVLVSKQKEIQTEGFSTKTFCFFFYKKLKENYTVNNYSPL